MRRVRLDVVGCGREESGKVCSCFIPRQGAEGMSSWVGRCDAISAIRRSRVRDCDRGVGESPCGVKATRKAGTPIYNQSSSFKLRVDRDTTHMVQQNGQDTDSLINEGGGGEERNSPF